jgi:hypothetical protein
MQLVGPSVPLLTNALNPSDSRPLEARIFCPPTWSEKDRLDLVRRNSVREFAQVGNGCAEYRILHVADETGTAREGMYFRF